MSQISAAPLRTTYWVFQIGSKLARSGGGTRRRVRAAGRWAIAGAGSARAATAPAAVFKNALRCMTPPTRLQPYEFARPLCGLAHPPEEWQRPFDNPTHVPAPGLVFQEEASRRIDHRLERSPVEAADRGLLLLQGLGLLPRGSLRLALRCVWPAEPTLVSARPHADCDGRTDAVGARMPGVEHVPAALARRRFHRAAGADRAPVGGDEIDVHAEALQEVGRDVTLRLGDGLILGDNAADGLARIARLRQQLLCRIEIARAFEDVAAFLRIEWRPRCEEAGHRLPQRGVVAHQGAHVVFLAHRHQDCPACPHVVEGRVEMIHAEAADVAQRILDVDRDIAVLAEQWHQVGNRVLPPVDFAVLQCRRGGRRIRHDDPFYALRQHVLAAREPRRWLLARHVVWEI